MSVGSLPIRSWNPLLFSPALLRFKMPQTRSSRNPPFSTSRSHGLQREQSPTSPSSYSPNFMTFPEKIGNCVFVRVLLQSLCFFGSSSWSFSLLFWSLFCSLLNHYTDWICLFAFSFWGFEEQVLNLKQNPCQNLECWEKVWKERLKRFKLKKMIEVAKLVVWNSFIINWFFPSYLVFRRGLCYRGAVLVKQDWPLEYLRIAV